MHVCPHQTCNLSKLHATFSRLSTHLKGSSGHSSNVCSQLQTLMACLEILLDKPQTLEPEVTTWNMHDKCVDYFYLTVIHLKETTHKPKANHQNFQVWKAKGYLVLLRLEGWHLSKPHAGKAVLTVCLEKQRGSAAVQREPYLSEKNPCSHPLGPFWIICPCLIQEEGPE